MWQGPTSFPPVFVSLLCILIVIWSLCLLWFQAACVCFCGRPCAVLSHVYFHLSGLRSMWFHCQAGSVPGDSVVVSRTSVLSLCFWAHACVGVSAPLSSCLCVGLCLSPSACPKSGPTQAHTPSIPAQTPTPSYSPHGNRTLSLFPFPPSLFSLSLSPPRPTPAPTLQTTCQSAVGGGRLPLAHV